MSTIVVLLAVAPLTVWWNWPRGDERFVGKWEMFLAVNEEMGPLLQLTFNRDGTLSAVKLRQVGVRLPGCWHAEAGVLVCGSSVPKSLWFARSIIEPVMRQITKRGDWGKEERFDINSCTSDAIDLRHELHMARYLLRRIPE